MLPRSIGQRTHAASVCSLPRSERDAVTLGDATGTLARHGDNTPHHALSPGRRYTVKKTQADVLHGSVERTLYDLLNCAIHTTVCCVHRCTNRGVHCYRTCQQRKTTKCSKSYPGRGRTGSLASVAAHSLSGGACMANPRPN